MLHTFLEMVHISRPHIWLYTLGTFLFGAQTALLLGYHIQTATVLMFILVLTVPVNIFIYGLNDYYDTDTDAENPKKSQLEHNAGSDNRRVLLLACLGLAVVLPFIFLQNMLTIQLFALWLLLVVTYNIPAVRLKDIPVLDMLFAFNFPLWGFIGYALVSGTLPPLGVVVPIFFLSVVFHLYSAIHDMPYDTEAGSITTAVWVGSVPINMLLCIVGVCGAVISIYLLGAPLVALVVSLYGIFFLLHFLYSPYNNDLLYAYRHFLIAHYGIGFLVSVTFPLYV